jgi:hypothetical protein
MASPRLENDLSPLLSHGFEVPQSSAEPNTEHALQDDEVAGFLSSRNLPETELRLASRFKDVNTDVSFLY